MVGLREFFTIKMVYFRSYPNIPAFQHSILPWRWYKQVATKKLVILTGCRNSDTFNYGASSSGKTQDFGSCIRRFESSRPSQVALMGNGNINE
jgi:hypothetical protein